MLSLLHVQASKVKKLDSAANVTNISLEAAKAAEADNTRQLHECRRKLYGGHKKPPQMVKLADGSFAQTPLQARLRWKEFFSLKLGGTNVEFNQLLIENVSQQRCNFVELCNAGANPSVLDIPTPQQTVQLPSSQSVVAMERMSSQVSFIELFRTSP